MNAAVAATAGSADPVLANGTAGTVAVVGSTNLDLVAHTARAPEAGETVLGTDFTTAEGGKGANQAAAAAAFAPTAFVGCVGEDDAGRRLIARLDAAGVRTDRVRRSDLPSGHALITVSDDGENRIVVVPGANQDVTAEHVSASLDALQPALVMCQLEIPLEAVTAAARWARANGALFLLNPSPVRELPGDLIALIDVLLVNVGEARALLAQADPATAGQDAPLALADALREDARTVVVTAGGGGAVFSEPGGSAVHVPAEPVQAVDTTGAGDAFAGALAGLLARGTDVETCVREASAAAARVVALPRDLRDR